MHGSIFYRLPVLLLLIGSLSNTPHSSPLMLLLLPEVSAFCAPPAAAYKSHSYFTSPRQPQQQHHQHHVQQQQQTKRRLAVVTAAATTEDDDPASGATAPSAAAATISTDQEIEAMVLGLSREASDDIRRATLKAKLTDLLLEAGGWDRAKEIDACIVGLGGRLQKQAANGAAGNNNDDGASEQQQIWALVDMMVQTKTILNRFKQNEFRKRQEEGTSTTSPEEQDLSSPTAQTTSRTFYEDHENIASY